MKSGRKKGSLLRPWSEAEQQTLDRIWRARVTEVSGDVVPFGVKAKVLAEIAAATGRTISAVWQRVYQHRTDIPFKPRRAIVACCCHSVQLAPELAAAARRRADARQAATLTAQLCGDPPPGFSALDEKQAEHRP